MMVARRAPIAVKIFRRLTSRMLKGDPEEIGKKIAGSFPPVDRQIIEAPGNMKGLGLDILEGYRQGWQGPAQDDIIINNPWGFRLENITVRIDIWQGEVDKNVPLCQGKYQDERIANSRFTVLPGQAHLYLLTHWREVLSVLVE